MGPSLDITNKNVYTKLLCWYTRVNKKVNQEWDHITAREFYVFIAWFNFLSALNAIKLKILITLKLLNVYSSFTPLNL